MTENCKVVRDPIHGNIQVKDYFVDLLETPEIQRLYNIKQLGFAHLVFPGAHHTRLEHSLGTYKIASQISEILNIEDSERNILTCAALLHDIGHGPFSHTLESILMEKFGVDHVDLTEKLVLGEYEIFESDEKKFIKSQSVNQILNKNNMDKEGIVKIIRGKTYRKSYLSQILNSTIDADQLDYLIRDAYYTGVAYGMIDIERLLQTLIIHEGNLTIKRKGVSVVENILMARDLMYSSVYFHKTVRIAELMLSKALEGLPDTEPFEFFRMTDAEIINKLMKMGDFRYEIITRIKYRRLFKQAYSASFYDLDKQDMNVIKNLENVNERRQKERELENAFNIPKGHLIIDIPRLELLKAEPRIDKTDISVIDRDKVKKLDDFTPVAKAIRSRITPDWIVMIITDEKYRETVSEKVEERLFN
ncbi:MAG: HD domain-containing protein [Thermoplasmatales archaeon]|nr:MAG: HD domain-containing protein [Thermoplasmatales archaeon]